MNSNLNSFIRVQVGVCSSMRNQTMLNTEQLISVKELEFLLIEIK